MLRLVRVRLALLALGLFLSLGLILLASRPSEADLPFPDSVLVGTGATLDYSVPAALHATVDRGQAIASARGFTNAPADAVVQSARLALWSDPDPSHKGLLVWAVHLEGLNLPAGGPVPIDGTPRKPEIITRSLVLVSATEPSLVLGAVQQARPNP